MTDNYSDYVVFVDESGDHGLKSIDENYPVFVLVFCIMRKSDYTDAIVPSLQKFKFSHFGHDQVILHEVDIRKDRGFFSFLKTRELKEKFYTELTDVVRNASFTLVSTVINKVPYKRRYSDPPNPYHIALGYGLERVFYYLRSMQSVDSKTHVIFERRGKKEDSELELEFRRVCGGANYEGLNLPFNIIFADKKSNSIGLQLADLIARPVGLKILRPQQANRAYEVIETKFYRSETGQHVGWGLKIFP